ncbi:pilus assembly protein [Gardnerella leopoldii]|uniref:Pilus assembly protein n=1 Tax=Gardnerella leopoldii TaxID=2792978 RepID=A0ABX4SFA0_9BIFI|nr:prealbumin-like fold domain-containing protein [Gardnerella vaginalis]PKZ18711.1 pilus assembly protein [Gardnerella vaginalis]PKZ19863.1 pilus assembly protein [Gardnerella vaginalis]
MKKFTNKFVAAVASLAMAGTLCVAGAVTVSSVAWGAPPVRQTPVSKAPWETDAPKNGTITILKCVKKTKDDNSTTSQTQTDPQCKIGFKPLKDATFKLTKVTSVKEGDKYVNLDLGKFESWQKIAKLVTKLNDHTIKDSGTDAEVKLDTDNAKTQTTGENGIAKFGDGTSTLALGLYKVEETNAPKGYGVSDLQSFYMTLPLPEYTTTGEGANTKTTVSYNYNPVVTPKNKDLSATIQKVYDKTKFASVKDKVPFTITAEVNKAKPKDGKLTAANLQGYKVFDDAPTVALTVQKPAGSTTTPTLADAVKTVKIGTTTLDKATATEPKDYKVTLVTDSKKDEGKDLADGHTRILVTFTDAGLGKIADALNNVTEGQEAPKVTVDLEFEISDAFKGGTAPTESKPMSDDDKKKDEIVNKSGFFQAHEKNEGDLPPIIPDNDHSQATIDFGFLQVRKFYKEGTEEKPLENAEFRIFADKAKADACAQGLKENKELGSIDACKAASTINDAAAAGASQPVGAATTDVQTATTDAKGNFAKAYKTRAGVPVYLVEVKAPKGYAISPVVHDVTVKKDQTTTEPFEDLPLKGGDNGKSFWFNLPATGAYGVLIFAVVGMVLIVASVIMYMRNRKEEEQQQNA